jgi:hypothetical protein
MINTSSGFINVTNTVAISPLVSIDTLINFFKTNASEKWDVRNGWVHYYLKNFQIQQRYFFFDFMFFKNILSSVSFCFYNQLVKNVSWADWSEENELKKQLEYEAWLEREIGSARSFEWGTINSYYDAKGGSSGIIIIYKEAA